VLIVDVGTGPPVMLVPGIQGRWEWMAPAIDALARRCRVLSFSLCDEPTSGCPCDPSLGFDNYIVQAQRVLDAVGVRAATVAGVSYGGAIAAELAARVPSRVRSLVLVSATPPDWTPDSRARFYMRSPRLLSPLFCLTAPARVLPEIRTAIPAGAARRRFVATHSARVLRSFLSPTRVARRVRWLQAHDFAAPHAIQAPTLIVTGEARLDHVVPTRLTLRYRTAMPSARHVVLAGTGHLGLVTRPDAFASIVSQFAAGSVPAGIPNLDEDTSSHDPR
jgi:pimeloyl-ACP methyl ester carboxylesterase